LRSPVVSCGLSCGLLRISGGPHCKRPLCPYVVNDDVDDDDDDTDK